MAQMLNVASGINATHDIVGSLEALVHNGMATKQVELNGYGETEVAYTCDDGCIYTIKGGVLTVIKPAPLAPGVELHIGQPIPYHSDKKLMKDSSKPGVKVSDLSEFKPFEWSPLKGGEKKQVLKPKIGGAHGGVPVVPLCEDLFQLWINALREQLPVGWEVGCTSPGQTELREAYLILGRKVWLVFRGQQLDYSASTQTYALAFDLDVHDCESMCAKHDPAKEMHRLGTALHYLSEGLASISGESPLRQLYAGDAHSGHYKGLRLKGVLCWSKDKLADMAGL